MIWACSPEFLENRRQLRKLKPRPAGRLANAWHTFVNFSCYCILNDASSDNMIEQVLDELAVIVPSHESSVVTTRSILMAEQASNSSGLQQSNSLRKLKRRSSSILSSLLPKSSVAPLVLPSSSSSSQSSSLSSTSPPSLLPPSATSPSSSSSSKLCRKRFNNDTASVSSIATCSGTSKQDEDVSVVRSQIEKVETTSNDVETDMRSNMDLNNHIRALVPRGTITDANRLIKRTLDWGMPSASTSGVNPSSVVPTSNTVIKPVKHPSQWDESIVNVEVLLGRKQPKNQYEAMAQQRELGNETPYWMIEESSDKCKEPSKGASHDVEESRDGGVDSGVGSRNVSRTV